MQQACTVQPSPNIKIMLGLTKKKISTDKSNWIIITILSPAKVLDNDIIMLDVQTIQQNLSRFPSLTNQELNKLGNG